MTNSARVPFLALITLFSTSLFAQFHHFNVIENLDNNRIPYEQSEIYQEILNEMSDLYQDVGERKTANILNYNRSFSLGRYNQTGFNWYRVNGNFGIYVNRYISPDISSDQFITRDTFDLIIDAKGYLTNLRNNNSIDISDKQLALFAGLAFKRTYDVVHMEGSYTEALTSPYNKLFLSFLQFSGEKFLDLEEYQIISKEDSISLKVGGYLSVPVYQNLFLTAGFLKTFNQVSSVKIQSLGEDDEKEEGEKLRISTRKTTYNNSSLAISLMADFYNILQITLFSYDQVSQFKEKHQIDLTLFENDINDIKNTPELLNEFRKIIHLEEADYENTLSRYIVSRERRISEFKQSRFQIFLRGSRKKTETEIVEITDDEKELKYYVSHYENEKYVKSPLSFVYSSINRKLGLKILPLPKLKSEQINVDISYLHIEDENVDLAPMEVHHLENAFIEISQRFFANNTTKNIRKKSKNEAINFLNQKTLLHKDIINGLDQNQIKGPLNIFSSLKIGAEGIVHFDSIEPKKIINWIFNFCNEIQSEKPHFIRDRFSKKLQKKCFIEVIRPYNDYVKNKELNKVINLQNLRDLIITISSYNINQGLIANMFGHENILHQGHISSKTIDDQNFVSFFGNKLASHNKIN